MGVIKGFVQNNVGDTSDVTVTSGGVDGKTYLDVAISPDSSLGGQGKLVTEDFDSVSVTSKNAEGCPLIVEYRLGTDLVATVTITYDVDGDLQSVSKA